MLVPRIDKVVVNMSVGRSGEPLENATRVLETLTGQRPSVRKARRTIKAFGISKDEPIACVVTLRGKRADDFLRKALQTVEGKLSFRNFDRQGNFSFGVKEHIDIPGVKYVPELGIHGMDVCVSFMRPGYRVARRKKRRARVGSSHLLTVKEILSFLKERFGVEVVHGKAKAS